jgi:hypothetical protein
MMSFVIKHPLSSTTLPLITIQLCSVRLCNMYVLLQPNQVQHDQCEVQYNKPNGEIKFIINRNASLIRILSDIAVLVQCISNSTNLLKYHVWAISRLFSTENVLNLTTELLTMSLRECYFNVTIS